MSGAARLLYDADVFDVAIEDIAIEDARLKTVWGDLLRRITLTVKNPEPQGGWTIRVTR